MEVLDIWQPYRTDPKL